MQDVHEGTMIRFNVAPYTEGGREREPHTHAGVRVYTHTNSRANTHFSSRSNWNHEWSNKKVQGQCKGVRRIEKHVYI